MEDLKQIQEFFSKPLNEVSGDITVEDFNKVADAIQSSGQPATIMLSPLWGKNEIDIVVGMDAPDSVVIPILNIMDNLGYDSNKDYSVSGDSSNLSRREYTQIRRVNGGHKDYERYFEESLNENEDPIVVKYFKRGDTYFQILVKYERPTGFTTALGRRTALGSQIDQNEAAAKERVKAIVNKLKEDFNLDDIFVEKGQVAGRYYINAFSDDFIDMDVNDLEGFYTLEEATKEEENEFHKKLDKLVHKTFGHSSDEKKKMAEYIAETIKLGMSLNEELCDKGKRYIKARQAAGEKSSAYLSGRAVRVCKGQIEWPKKGKKKK